MQKSPTIGILIPQGLLGKLFSGQALEALKGIGTCRFNTDDDQLDETQAIELLREADIAVGSWGTPMPSQALLDACPRLRLWQHVAGSVKRYFGPHMQGRELVIASCAPAIADSVAEMTLGELIVGLRRLLSWNAFAHDQTTGTPAAKVNLFRATVGVIGASQVGRRVVKLLNAFEAKVLLYDPFLSEADATALGAELETDLVELFRKSDAVTLHTPNLPETRRMIGAAHFDALRDHGVFVNTSRGSCVDEPALVAALQERPLYAFLDVIDSDYSDSDNPLRRLPNCFLTPHIAGGPNQRMGDQAVSDIKAFLDGGEPLMPVKADQLSRLA
jgi:phosphoglycerate dehydrogenase-like enzyme